MEAQNNGDTEVKSLCTEENNIIFQHKPCQTRKAKWMAITNIYQKFHRPNLYDIGGTYIEMVPDFWFLFKTEQVGSIFLFHLFAFYKQMGPLTLAVSINSQLDIDKKNNIARLPTSLKQISYQNPNKGSHNYLCTYSFTESDVEMLKDRKLYIAVDFPIVTSEIDKQLINNVKLNHDFGWLLTDPIGSDFVIESGDGQQLKVHKLLLVSQSDVFKAMLKEDTAESQNNFVKLVDVSSEDLSHMIEFIYTGTIKEFANANFTNLLMLADQYNLKGLRDLSEYVLCQHLDLENALQSLVFADMCNSAKLKVACLNFIKKFPSVIKSSQFKQIRNVELIQELCEHITSL